MAHIAYTSSLQSGISVSMARLGLEEWAEIKRLYEGGSSTVNALCQQFGLSRNELYRRVNKEGWNKRQTKMSRGRRAPLEQNHPATGADELDILSGRFVERVARDYSDRASRRDFVVRLYKALDLKISEVEDRMVRGEGGNAADGERDARTLTSLVRLFEKLTEIDEGCGREDGLKRGSKIKKLGVDSDTGDDADLLRLDLARRLDALSKSGET